MPTNFEIALKFGIDKRETMCTCQNVGDTGIHYQRQHFETFCKECYANQNDQTSKTISKDTGQKIVRPRSSELQFTVLVLVEKAWVSANQLFYPQP